jgi:hypothetical protein
MKLDQYEIETEILISKETRLTIVAALNDVQRNTGERQGSTSGHGRGGAGNGVAD